LILLDIALPGRRRLRDHAAAQGFRRLATIPIVVMSARTTAGIRERALEAGAAAFLEKPFAAGELLSTVGTILAARMPNRPGAMPA
jgi:DNA-binding response OmpR family regulator